MTVNEIKTKLQELIKTIPDENLEEVYNLIRNLKDVSPTTIKNTKNLSRIIKEDQKLLKKLAE